MKKIVFISLILSLFSQVCFAQSSLFKQFGYSRQNAYLKQKNPFLLYVPMADFQDSPGFYQNAEFLYLPAEDRWILRNVVDVPQLITDAIKTVEVVLTGELPVQAFLKVSGEFEYGCTETGEVALSMSDDTLHIAWYYPGKSYPITTACASTPPPPYTFSKIIPLPIYDFKAGEYSYVFNNTYSGTFTLTKQNVLQ